MFFFRTHGGLKRVYSLKSQKVEFCDDFNTSAALRMEKVLTCLKMQIVYLWGVSHDIYAIKR